MRRAGAMLAPHYDTLEFTHHVDWGFEKAPGVHPRCADGGRLDEWPPRIFYHAHEIIALRDGRPRACPPHPRIRAGWPLRANASLTCSCSRRAPMVGCTHPRDPVVHLAAEPAAADRLEPSPAGRLDRARPKGTRR